MTKKEKVEVITLKTSPEERAKATAWVRGLAQKMADERDLREREAYLNVMEIRRIGVYEREERRLERERKY